ncbi:MAG: BamA/TamA family outer membrane protein [Myxococcota bacterium]
MALSILLAACGGRRGPRAEPPGPVVRKVEVDGAERIAEDEVIEHLNMRPTSVLSVGGKSYYLPGLEAVDRRRIEQLYDAHGYYDAEVRAIDVEIRRSEAKVRRQRAIVSIEVDEGAPCHVRRRTIEWVEPVDSAVDRAAVEQALGLRPGEQFGVPALRDSAEQTREHLSREGFAYAQVRESATVDRSRHLADVHFEVDLGPRKIIESVIIEGLVRVPEELVQREIEFVRGQRYSPQLMHDVERAIYALGVFSAVTVELPPRSAGGSLTVQARVYENPMQRVRIGGGIGIDPVRWEQRASFQYRHHNLFGRLARLTLRAKVGYAELPTLYRPQQHGPIAGFDVALRKKGLLEAGLVWVENPGIELGLWDGYQFYSVTHRLGVSRFFTRFFELGLSYNNRFTDFFRVSEQLDRSRTILGLDFRDPYLLAFVQAAPVLHLTDDLLAPRNGVRIGVTYDLASTYLGGQYDYHKLEPDLRAYYRPHARVQLAARARVGLIAPFGRNPGVPFDLKLYLGGTGDVRGWPLRRISPRLPACDAMGTECLPNEGISIGGLSMLQGSFELRVRTYRDLWLAGFADAGDVREGVADYKLRGLMYSTGGGLRYDSQVGVLRLDVGVQLNEDPRFPEPRRWALHLGIGEAF